MADFSGIVNAAGWYAAINKVVHKAYIDVDERRTDAAGATVVEMVVEKALGEPPKPVVMKIDRPFILLIQDIETDASLFAGRVMQPAPQGGHQ